MIGSPEGRCDDEFCYEDGGSVGGARVSVAVSRGPRVRRGRRKRAAIIKSAIAEFLKHGFEQTSIDDIAARSGVARQTIYAHFSSKGGLIDTIEAECVPWPDEIADLRYDPDAPLDAQLTRIGRVFLSVYTSDAFIVVLRVRLARWVETPKVSGPIVSSQLSLFTASLRAWVEAATRDGRLAATNAGLAAGQFHTLLTAPIWLGLTGQPPPPHQQDELLEAAVTMLLKTYQAPSDRIT